MGEEVKDNGGWATPEGVYSVLVRLRVGRLWYVVRCVLNVTALVLFTEVVALKKIAHRQARHESNAKT
jgi:hypothetical protein